MTGLVILAGIVLMLLVGWQVANRLRAQTEVDTVLADRLYSLAPSIAVRPVGQSQWLSQLQDRAPVFLQRWLDRSDVTISVRGVAIYLAVATVVVAMGAEWRGPLVGLGLATVAAALPLWLLQRLANKRMAAFVEVLPHFLDSVRQLLAVGNSFQQALIKSVENGGPPIQRYLLPAIRRIRNGAPLADALDTVADRIDLAEFHMVIATIRTNTRFGGSVGPTLAGLVSLLRDRARVVRELGAASSETRMSARILCALPPVAMALIAAINYGYMKYLWETEAGRHLLMIGVSFQALGMITMRRIMKLDF